MTARASRAAVQLLLCAGIGCGFPPAPEEVRPADDDTASGVREVSPATAYSARPGSLEARLRPQMLRWAPSLRRAASPVLRVIEAMASSDGMGEEHCTLLAAARQNLEALSPPPDDYLASVLAPIPASLAEPERLCGIWDPGPLVDELLTLEHALADLDLDLATYYGLQALPELSFEERGPGGRVEPLQRGEEVRIRWIGLR